NSRWMCGMTSRHGYGSVEYNGIDDSFTDTFGYFASEATTPISSCHLALRMKAVEMPMLSTISVNPGCRSAMRPISAFCPLVRNITGTLAFSAAGQNQSATLLVSHSKP